MIHYECEMCGAEMQSPAGLQGHYEECPSCGALVEVRDPERQSAGKPRRNLLFLLKRAILWSLALGGAGIGCSVYVTGGILHVWAALGIGLLEGVFWGIFAFFLPVAASIWYIVLTLRLNSGLYTLICGIWVGLGILSVVFIMLGIAGDERMAR